MILENCGTFLTAAKINYPHALEFVPECYKTQNMCDKDVNTYPSTIKYVPECLLTEEMCDKAINTYSFAFDSAPDRYKTQKCLTELFMKIHFNYILS